jgi:hypothetical protein
MRRAIWALCRDLTEFSAKENGPSRQNGNRASPYRSIVHPLKHVNEL